MKSYGIRSSSSWLKIIKIFILVISTFGPESFAQTQKGYGQAGCGLGSMVFGSQKGPVQIFAATLNGTGSQTIAMTLGTSNCKGVFGRSTTEFLEANKNEISLEAAKGTGETIVSLATLYGCNNATLFGMTLKKNYETIFPKSPMQGTELNRLIIETIKEESSILRCDAV
ncbi:MAG: DUF3015 family protein [Bacteriovoracaceae bacterium]|nr:DUF3015 family protein [Bacteriovoracaceae bacterium]